jgi:hypothetical protein
VAGLAGGGGGGGGGVVFLRKNNFQVKKITPPASKNTIGGMLPAR